MRRIEEKKTVPKTTDVIRVASWSELCSDLIEDIISRLGFADLVRFQAVCKSWHNVYLSNKFHAVCNSLGLKSTSILSWFVRVFRTNQELEFHLYAPWHSIDEPIRVHSIPLREVSIPILSAWSDIRIFCKCGWLFISVSERINCPNVDIYFTLFSPLTRKLKKLPCHLNSPAWCIEQTFSWDPESADCVFLLLDTRTFDDKFVVATCRKDDKKWTVRQFAKEKIFKRAACMPVFARGIFYIVSPYGQLAYYDVIENKMKSESLAVNDDLAENYTYEGSYMLFMVNGELFYDFGSRANPCTVRYDHSKKVWVPVSSFRGSANTIIHSGGLICPLESFDLVRVMRNSPGFIFYSGSSHWARSDLFFWLEPSLSETETMHTNQVNG